MDFVLHALWKRGLWPRLFHTGIGGPCGFGVCPFDALSFAAIGPHELSLAAIRASETGPIVHQPAVNSLSSPSQTMPAIALAGRACDRRAGADRGDRRGDISRLRPRLGRLHPFAIRQISWCRCFGPALRTSARCRSSISTCTAAGSTCIATLAAKILPFGLFETRRLIGAAIGLIGLFVTWRLGRRLGGPFAGLMALVLLATCPLYYGHMFINAKDGPFAAVTVIALLGIVRAFEEYPRATPPTIALCGIGIGLVDRRTRAGRFRRPRRAAAAAAHPRNPIARDRIKARRSPNADCFLSRSFPPRSLPISSWAWSGRGAWFPR